METAITWSMQSFLECDTRHLQGFVLLITKTALVIILITRFQLLPGFFHTIHFKCCQLIRNPKTSQRSQNVGCLSQDFWHNRRSLSIFGSKGEVLIYLMRHLHLFKGKRRFITKPVQNEDFTLKKFYLSCQNTNEESTNFWKVTLTQNTGPFSYPLAFVWLRYVSVIEHGR